MASPIPEISVGGRFDRVLPDGPDTSAAYSALSPRVIIHTKFLSREYVILSYTRFFLGEEAYPSFPVRQSGRCGRAHDQPFGDRLVLT